MEFYRAIDQLVFDQNRIAEALEMERRKLASVKTKNKRGSHPGPLGWEHVIITLAERQVAVLQVTIDTLRKQQKADLERFSNADAGR